MMRPGADSGDQPREDGEQHGRGHGQQRVLTGHLDSRQPSEGERDRRADGSRHRPEDQKLPRGPRR